MIFNYTQRPASSGESVKPAKGFVPTAFNSDGYPTAGVMYGAWSEIPEYYFYTNVATSGSTTGKVGEGYFKELSSLSFDVPNNTYTIGGRAFMGLMRLPMNTVPNAGSSGNISIGAYAFANCAQITKFTFPSNTYSVGNYVFSGCTNLTQIQFKGTPSDLRQYAFQGLTQNLTIYVPWSAGAVANAPWGASNATIHYNYNGADI